MDRLAIFDLDGTLVNSVADLANAVKHALKKMNYPTHPVAAYCRFVYDGVRKLCEHALPKDASVEHVDKILAMFQAYYVEHCMDCTKLYDGIQELLQQLQSDGIFLAVASNKPQAFAEQIATHFFGTDCFSKILGGNETRPKKPSPEILLDLLAYFDISRENAILIGDFDVDLKTAKNAQIDVIGCTWGFRSREELVEAGAVYLADSPKDVAQIIRKQGVFNKT